jgi:hypothetical protein
MRLFISSDRSEASFYTRTLGLSTIYCLEEWRGEQMAFTPYECKIKKVKQRPIVGIGSESK